MIPFWKKTGKHSKSQSAQKRRQKAQSLLFPGLPSNLSPCSGCLRMVPVG